MDAQVLLLERGGTANRASLSRSSCRAALLPQTVQRCAGPGASRLTLQLPLHAMSSSNWPDLACTLVPWRATHCNADQFIELKSVFDWLDSKRTSMRLASGVEAKLGHMPQVPVGAVGAVAGAGRGGG